MIVLHEPHIDIRKTGCISVQKVFNGAHAILNQLYAIWSTSYDLTLLDNFCCVRRIPSVQRMTVLPIRTVRVFHGRKHSHALPAICERTVQRYASA